jgi:integrase
MALTVRGIETAKHPQNTNRPIRIGDKDGLYLQITPNGSKSWLFRYTLDGKSREMGLGSYGDNENLGELTLVQARAKAHEKKAMLKQKIDPIEFKLKNQSDEKEQEERAANQRKFELKNTFEAIALEFINKKQSEWKNAIHAKQWPSSLRAYVFPMIGHLPVKDITKEHIRQVLDPIWTKIPESASRIRGRIEKILDYAAFKDLRTGDNPARWQGNLREGGYPLPAKVNGKEPKHHPALPWQQMPDFMNELIKKDSIDAIALQVTILTAVRTSECLNAKWREINIDEGIWIIPGSRTKRGKEHRVPLCKPALELLKRVLPLSRGYDSPVFPSTRTGNFMSQMSMLMLLRRMNTVQDNGKAKWLDRETDKPISVHGFRSTFRDWCGEVTSYQTILAEAALAHVIGDKTETSYARGDMFQKRSKLMDDWASHCFRKKEL